MEDNNCVNSFPIDEALKITIANIVCSKIESMGYELTKNTARHFANECSGELIESILEAIHQWTTKKLN